MISEQQETSFFDSHPIFIYDFEDMAILDANKPACSAYGFNLEEFRSMAFTDLEVGSSASIPEKGRQIYSFHNGSVRTHKKSDGATFQVHLTAHNVEYMGKPARMVIVKEANEEHSSDDRNVSFYTDNILPFAEIDWEDFNNIVRWDKDAERLFGWTEQEVRNHSDFTSVFITPQEKERLQERFNKAEKNKERSFKHINKNFTKDGKEILCEWYNSIVYDEQGHISFVYSMVHDVTDVYENIDHLKRLRDSYRDLFNSISDAVYIQSLDGTILEMNMATRRMFGYSREEITGEHFSKLAAPGKFDLGEFENIVEKVKAGKSQQFEAWGKRKNGEVFPKHVHISMANYFGKQVFISITKDLSEQFSAREALKKRNELFLQLFENSPIGIVLLNKHNEIEMVNAGFEELFGYNFDELKNLELDKVIVGEGRRKEAMKLSESTEAFVTESKRIHKDGTVKDVIIYGVPVTLEGKTLAIFGMYVDITDKKKAEKKIQKSLREKEILLAEIHHRVKNNLAVITGLLELQSYNTESESARQALVDSQRRVNSISLVHEKLYQSESFSEIQFDNYLEELIKVIKMSIGRSERKVNIEIDADPVELTLTQAIPCGLLLNEVVTNAFKHAFADKENPNIKITFKENDGQLLFRVRDNGVGFPGDMKEHTSDSLGLKLIETLSKQLDGKLEFWNEDGGVVEVKFKLAKS